MFQKFNYHYDYMVDITFGGTGFILFQCTKFAELTVTNLFDIFAGLGGVGDDGAVHTLDL